MTQELQARLREQGYRITPQRMMILDALARRGHMSAEEIHSIAAESFPYVNLSTVYRTLEMLVTEGIVSQAPIGEGRTFYEMAAGSDPHHHLVCRRCDGIEHIAARHIDSVEQHLLQEHGFEVEETVMTSFGRCRRCRKRKR